MQRLVKSSIDFVCIVVVLPIFASYGVAAAVLGRGRAFPGVSQLWSLAPGTMGVFLRRAVYRLTLAECGKDCYIGFGTVLSHPTACIGARAYVGVYCVLGDVTIEEDVLIGSHVSIINGNRQHGIERLDVPIREQPGEYPRVTIGRDSWIGDRSVVMADIGEQCVIGAGSVVTKPIPPRSIAVGNPARVIRKRGEELPASTISGSEPLATFDDRNDAFRDQDVSESEAGSAALKVEERR